MERAKEAVSGFLHKGNHHDATIEQTVNAPVVHERVQETKLENTTTALDREVHEHHHQTRVQPVQDRQVLPETHHQNVIPVEHREHHHGKDREIEAALREKSAGFRDTTETLQTQEMRGQNQAVAAEHHHHRIHETIQPVIEKEVIQPHVVHTVIPIHERIDKEPTVHKTTVEQPITMAEFEAGAGHHVGKTHKEHYEYTGEPMNIDPNAQVGIGRHQMGGGSTGHTHGRNKDLDGDGIPDRLEGKHKHHGRNKDMDDDGIPDRLEGGARGTTGTGGGLLGRNKDRDGDGIPDRLEGGAGNTTGTGGGLLNRNRDRDGDGIPDRLEGGAGNTTGTGGGLLNRNRDRDGDGIPDRLEGGAGNTTGGMGVGGTRGGVAGTGLQKEGNMIDSNVHSEPGYDHEKKSGISGLIQKVTGK